MLFLDQIQETIDHEVSLVAEAEDFFDSLEDLEYVCDLTAIVRGDKHLDEVCSRARAFCEGRGPLNAMLLEEAGDIETGLKQYLAFYVNEVDGDLQSRDGISNQTGMGDDKES